jgi:hypothetical protein
MDKITKSLLDTFSSQNEISNKTESVQFENFANYCITSKIFRGSFELEDIHTGKGGDCAIDGISITINGRLVSNVEEMQEIVTAAGQLDAEITFIQAKTSSNFDGSSIGTFIHGAKDFLSDNPKLVQNDKIKDAKKIWEAVIDMSDYMINRRPNLNMYYVCTGKWVSDTNLVAIIESGKEEIERIGLFENISITPIGANEIQKLYQESKNRLHATINFQNRVTLPDIQGVTEAYLGVIPFDEFKKLIQDDTGSIYNIFYDNIRDFQGDNNVNAKIRGTLEDKKFDLFCVLNNGVTIVAGSLTPAGNRFTIRDYQVVNGCQTSHVLNACSNIDGIEKVFVPVKIIVTSNEDIKTSITLATNSQTEVKTEQLEALSAFQKKLELYYNAEQNNIHLYYERRSQQYNATETKRTQIISIPVQIKSFASMFLDSPHLVSGYYGTIVKRFSSKIFGEDDKLIAYYLSGLAYYRIEQMFRSGEVDSRYKKYRFHIMLLVKLIAMGKDNAPFNSGAFEKACSKLNVILIDEIDKSALDKEKRQYKSESETLLVTKAFEEHIQNKGQQTP